MPKTDITVTLVSPGSYHVSRDKPRNGLFTLTHRCWSGEDIVVNQYVSLPWYSLSDTSADVGPLPLAGDRCDAFVWKYPDPTTPVSNVVDYEV